MNRSHLIKELRTAISFYQELGFSYFPVKKSALEDRLRTLSVTPDKNTVPSNIISTAVLPVISPAESETFTLEEIRQELGECTRCKLSEGRRNIVFGEGNPGAQIMFIGERPRREEDIQGKPFA
ncbi:uracil-DNA glycosylase, partial [bacterium]|nr:uracil-DNA glycosylase [bacterium]